jgi:hypothetical protein
MNFSFTGYFILHIKLLNVNTCNISNVEYYVYKLHVVINVTWFKSLGYQTDKKTKKTFNVIEGLAENRNLSDA